MAKSNLPDPPIAEIAATFPMMPAVRGDAMRGLAVFISDIRNCKSKEAEVKRINKELANIRSVDARFILLLQLHFGWISSNVSKLVNDLGK